MCRLMLTFLLVLFAEAPVGEVLPKVGKDCPRGTYATGDYCKYINSIDERSTRIIGNPSGGRCPTGWYRSGDYGKAQSKRSVEQEVIQKVGDDCPTGMYSSGSFCKSFN